MIMHLREYGMPFAMAMLLLGTVAFGPRLLAGAPPATTTVVAGPFEELVAGTGALAPAQRHMVSAPYTAKLERLTEEGKEVKAGSVVAQLATQNIDEERAQVQLRVDTMLKDEELRALTAARDRKQLQTDRRAATDALALARLTFRQQVAGLPAPDREALVIRAAAAKRTYETALQSFTLQKGLLAKGIIRPIDLDATELALHAARRAHEVADTALLIARRGYPAPAVEAARLAVEHAANDLALVDGKLAGLVRSTALDARYARAERAAAGARLNILDHRKAAATLRAPTAGLVVMNVVRVSGGARRKLQVGDDAREGQPFMEIADVGRVVVKGEVAETDLGRVAVGMAARVHVAGVPAPLAGRLESLGVLAYEKPDAVNREGAPRVFSTRVALIAPKRSFRPGLSVDVELVAHTLADALTVPNTALARHDGLPCVWLYHPGGAIERRDVTPGPHDATRTVVKTGVAVGDRVLLEPPS